MLLTKEELQSLTGYKRPADQVAELRRQGFYRARTSPTTGSAIRSARTMTPDDMVDNPYPLYDLAHNEGCTTANCPSCDLTFWVQGGYSPHFSTAFAEELL